MTAAGTSIGNAPIALSFTVMQLTATLVNPTPGTTPDADTLNDTGYIDVPITLPAYATSLDLASVESVTPKFTVTVDNSSDGTLTLSTTQAPLLISQSGDTYTFRFFYTGTFRAGPLTLDFIGNSFNYLDSGGQAIPDFADESLAVQQNGNTLFVDVSFGTSQTLNTASIASDAFDVTAITSSGTTTATTGVTVSGFDNGGQPGRLSV